MGKLLSILMLRLLYEDTYNLLNNTTRALVTSGTATLETAFFNVPQVVCYKSSWLSYFIAKSLVKIKYISLVNLIMEKEVVKELIQNNLSVFNITKELNKFNDSLVLDKMQQEYQVLIAKSKGKMYLKILQQICSKL